MKKLLFALLVCIVSITSYAQIINEEKLTLKPSEFSKIAFGKGNVDCKCGNNMLADGGFQNLSVVGSGSVPSNISSSSSPWKPGYNTPQWSNTIQPACDKGVVSMWGNKTVGESIYQNGLSLAPGCYTVKFTARFINPTALSSFVRLKLATYNGTGAPATYDPAGLASANITSNSWETYTFTFTTGVANSISLHPENDYTNNDGAYVSWIQIDNICIEKCCNCDISPNSPPAIKGTTLACACDPISFSTIKCPDAKYSWTVKDNKGNAIALTGNGTNAINLIYSLAQQVASDATSFTITVQINCGGTVVTSSIVVPVKPIPKTNVSFSLSDDGAGNYTATASALGSALGLGNGWTLKEVTCPGPNPCGWVAGPIKWQTTGTNIAIPSGVLVKGKCYILNHYVNVCSAKWVAGPCTVYKTTCFKLDGNQMKMMSRETDKNDAKEITAEMITDISKLLVGRETRN